MNLTKIFGKMKLNIVMFVVVVSATPANAVPVVPNFQQGQMTTHTETTSTVNETINSMDYNTGYTYSVSGHNVAPDGGLAPSETTTTSQSLNGVNSTWNGLDLGSNSRPTWSQVNQGGSFSFVETYSAPGLRNHTIIQRETSITSVTDTTSIFSQ